MKGRKNKIFLEVNNERKERGEMRKVKMKEREYELRESNEKKVYVVGNFLLMSYILFVLFFSM